MGDDDDDDEIEDDEDKMFFDSDAAESVAIHLLFAFLIILVIF